MVNVNAYHKQGFNFNFMMLSERGNHVHQTNGRFVYVGLNADCSRKVSERQQRNNIQCRLRILLHQSRQIINYNKFDGIMQTNLSRDKVEIAICFTTPFQTNRLRVLSATGINQQVSINKLCFYHFRFAVV